MEVNGIQERGTDHGIRREEVSFTDPDLYRIEVIRFLTDYNFPYWDLSYCYGVLKNGTQVRVQMPFFQLPKAVNGKRQTLSQALYHECVKAKVNGKRLKIYDAISYLVA